MELTARVHEENGALWADLPDLPGLFASGHTYDELVDSLREAICLYVEDPDADVQVLDDEGVRPAKPVASIHEFKIAVPA